MRILSGKELQLYMPIYTVYTMLVAYSIYV